MADLCPIKGCDTPLKPGTLMCWWHWQMVPRALQFAVSRTLHAAQKARGKEAARHWAAYRAARNEAIASVAARIHVRETIVQQEPKP